MILNPEILTLLLLDAVFMVFGFIAFVLSVKIALFWDNNATTQRQYKLVKQSYLGAVIIKYILSIKIPLILFFVFTLDQLSNVLNGAMCAAGVVNATSYGTYLLVLKIFNLYLFMYWLYLHNADISIETQPYTRKKFLLFVIIFFPFTAEIILEYMMFFSLDPSALVDCCGVIYSFGSESYFSYFINLLGNKFFVALFYINFIIIIFSYLFKKDILFSLLQIFFVIFAISTLISFFGTYIYEIPTHHCPFCLLQKEYYYIGYFLYTILFLGTFNGLAVGFVPSSENIQKKYYKTSLLFLSLYVVIVSFFVLRYYYINGVWL